MPGPLKNRRREAFCLLIIGPVANGKLSQAQAYLDAGFRARSHETAMKLASKMVRFGDVETRLAELHVDQQKIVQRVLDRYEVTVDKIVRRLALVAFADPGAYVKVYATENGGVDAVAIPSHEVFKNISDMSEDERAGLKLTRMLDGSIKAETRDPGPALVRLGQHMGMFAGEDAGSAPKPAAGDVHIHNDNRTQVYVDHAPRETREQWAARQRQRIAVGRPDEPIRQRPMDAAGRPPERSN